MHLTPRETERLLIAQAADLARRRLARGARLGAPEATALVSDEALEMAWDDEPLEAIISHCQALVDAGQLCPGVPAAVPTIQVEALFPHGTVLVHVPRPFGDPEGAGDVRPAEEPVTLAPGRARDAATLLNTGERPTWVSSHVPLDGLNPAIRVTPPGGGLRWRLDVPAGSALRLDPGLSREVPVVALAVQEEP